jgi:MFS family permease
LGVKLPLVYVATGVMLLQQALSTMAGLTLPVLVPPIAEETGLSPSLIGLYVPILYAGAMLSSVMAGGFMLRYGALRTSQICLLLTGLGLTINAGGDLIWFALGAIVAGFGGGPSTPASSQILARYTPREKAPLIFSIKQTGVPVGGMFAGVLLPIYVSAFGWRGALICAGLMSFAFVILVQPLRAEFDSDREPGRPLKFGDVRGTLTMVFRDPRIRELALSIFAFTGLQLAFASFFVSFLSVGLGWTLAEAGFAYSVAMVFGIGGRIFWGWVGTRFVAPLPLLGGLGIFMGLAMGAMACVDQSWSRYAVWTAAACFGLSGIGYQGVLLAEIARIAPPGMAGVVTGGTVFFAFAGMILMPAAYGLILSLGGGYSLAFAILGVPSLVAGGMLFRTVRRNAKLRT